MIRAGPPSPRHTHTGQAWPARSSWPGPRRWLAPPRGRGPPGQRCAAAHARTCRVPQPTAACAAPRYLHVGGDLAAVHPQQQLRLVQPDRAAIGVRPGERGVDLANPAACPLGLGRAPVRPDPDEFGGPHEPPPRFAAVSESGVLPGGAHRPRMKCLQVQGPQPGHPDDRLGHDLPGNRARAKEAAGSWPGAGVPGGFRVRQAHRPTFPRPSPRAGFLLYPAQVGR
jgi:hypothetical protein